MVCVGGGGGHKPSPKKKFIFYTDNLCFCFCFFEVRQLKERVAKQEMELMRTKLEKLQEQKAMLQ